MHDNWPGHVADSVDACIPEEDSQAWRRFGDNTLLPAGPEERGSGGTARLVADNDNRPTDPLALR